MGNHMNIDDRTEIQIGLKEGKSFTEIAAKTGKNKSTISREVLANRYFIHYDEVTTLQTKNVCVHRFKCAIKDNCKSPTCFRRVKNCKLCGMCNSYCKAFSEEICGNYERAPFVCNGCDKKPRCPLSKWVYEAKSAEKKYKSRLSNSRTGIALSDDELNRVDKIVSPLLKNGQSIRFVCSHKRDTLHISDKTIYNYRRLGVLSANLFDAKRTVQRKLRAKPGPPLLVDIKCRVGRTYDDFKKYLAAHPDTAVVEMDTIEGKKGGKVVLTLFFTNCNLQLGFLRDHNDAASVTKVFKGLRNALTDAEFIMLFSVILTDRGTEFSDPGKIEVDQETGEIQANVFFCDPQNTNQKSTCERNHEFFRYVIPKGTSLDDLSQEDISAIMDHINSYGRGRYNYKTPLDLFENIYGSEILKKLGVRRIAPDAVCLTSKLLKK